jgi:hypothetical protein
VCERGALSRGGKGGFYCGGRLYQPKCKKYAEKREKIVKVLAFLAEMNRNAWSSEAMSINPVVVL